MATFGTRLKELRKERGMRQADIAEMMGVTKGTVAKWEQGVRMPPIEGLEELCMQFDVTLGWLLGEEVDRTPKEPSDEFLARSVMEDDSEILTYMVKRLCRLSQQSRSIVQATLNAVYTLEKARKQLEPETAFLVSIRPNPNIVQPDEDKQSKGGEEMLGDRAEDQ